MHFVPLNHCFSFSILVISGVNVAPSGALEIANSSVARLLDMQIFVEFWEGGNAPTFPGLSVKYKILANFCTVAEFCYFVAT